MGCRHSTWIVLLGLDGGCQLGWNAGDSGMVAAIGPDVTKAIDAGRVTTPGGGQLGGSGGGSDGLAVIDYSTVVPYDVVAVASWDATVDIAIAHSDRL